MKLISGTHKSSISNHGNSCSVFTIASIANRSEKSGYILYLITQTQFISWKCIKSIPTSYTVKPYGCLSVSTRWGSFCDFVYWVTYVQGIYRHSTQHRLHQRNIFIQKQEHRSFVQHQTSYMYRNQEIPKSSLPPMAPIFFSGRIFVLHTVPWCGLWCCCDQQNSKMSIDPWCIADF